MRFAIIFSALILSNSIGNGVSDNLITPLTYIVLVTICMDLIEFINNLRNRK